MGKCEQTTVFYKNKFTPAPERLIKVIRYNCKLKCATKKCGCRKHGVDCTVGCGDFKGVSCSNSNLKNVTDEDMTKDM